MKKKITAYFLLLGSLLFATVFFPATAKDSSAQLRAKARHFYIEGSEALAEGRASEAYELIKKAAGIDPEYSEAAYSYAQMRLGLRNDTLSSQTETKRSVEMMRPFVEEYPREVNEAMNYSFLQARSGDLKEAIRVAERCDSLASEKAPILLQLAHYYSIAQENEKAIHTLDRYERIEGADPQLSFRKLSLMFAMGDTLRMLRESERLVEENPVNAEYIVLRGNVYDALSLQDSALYYYEKAERVAPDDGRVKLTLANYWLHLGDSTAYDEKSREALLSENIELDEKLEMMKLYMQNIINDSTADRRRGARLFDGLLLQYPHEPQVLDLGAQYSAATGATERAEELMEYAIDLDADNPIYWSRLASIYYTDDKYQQAIDACLRAMEKLPELPESMLYIEGSSSLRIGKYDDAGKAYGKILTRTLPSATLNDSPEEILAKSRRLSYDELRKIADLFQMAGDASFQSDSIDRALREYEVVMAIDPTDMFAANNFAFYLAEARRDLDRAEKLSRQTVADQPDNATFLDTLAWILYLKGEYAEALELQTKAIELVDQNRESLGEFWNHLGDIQYRSGLGEKAVESWKKAKQCNADDKTLPEKIKLKKIPD